MEHAAISLNQKLAGGSGEAATAKTEDVVMLHLIVWTAVIFFALFFLSFVVGMYQNRNEIKARWRRRGPEVKDLFKLMFDYLIVEKLLRKNYLGFPPVFTNRTVTNFSICYKLDLIAERPTPDGEPGLMKLPVQQVLEERYHQTAFLPFLESGAYGFRILWRKADLVGNVDDVFCITAGRFVENNGRRLFRDLTNAEFVEELKAIPFINKGRKISVQEFLPDFSSDELIKENYAMLTDEQKEEIQKDDSYVAYEERLAVSALKRRLEFQRAQSRQTHETSMISIQTDRAGNRVKISWQFKPEAPQGYDLLGFRRTGGFFADQWDENNNGTLVIHGQRGSAQEAIEPLQEGETYYYTFILKPWVTNAKSLKYGIARFQITITADETELIESTIRRIEEKKIADPGRENMSNALKELGLVMEFDEAVDEMEKSLIERIKNKNLPKEEEEVKIEFVRDTARLQRDKYQP